MRFIELGKLKAALSPEWLAKARNAYEEVRCLPPYKRAEAINERRDIWSELKEKLAQLSHGKCWYCESLEVRGDKAVDHYRPKNEVKKCRGHIGYWWLAFNWENFRYSCQYCNERRKDRKTGKTGGKGSYFPLLNETNRVFDEGEPYEILQEEPKLLDPTVMTDPLLVTFDLEGTAQPARKQEEFPNEYERAKVSIELYHLNHTDLKERRQVLVCNQIELLIEEGDKYSWLLQKPENRVAARQGYEVVMKRLLSLIREDAIYSAAARAVLKTYRDRIWVDEFLTAC